MYKASCFPWPQAMKYSAVIERMAVLVVEPWLLLKIPYLQWENQSKEKILVKLYGVGSPIPL